jgi:hypothetical protein
MLGLSPRKAVWASDRGGLGDFQHQIGRGIGRSHVEQASRSDQQGDRILAPLHARNTPLLAHEAIRGLFFLHQHMIEEKHQTLVHFTHQPFRSLGTGHHAFDETAQKEKGDCVAIVPDYS